MISNPAGIAGRDFMIFDCHNVVVSTEIRGCMGKINLHSVTQTPEELIQRMDKAGVDLAAVYSPRGGANNEFVSNVMKKLPKRVVGLAYINPNETGALKELKKCINILGLKGIKLNPVIDKYSLGNLKLMRPIFEFCTQRDVVVLAHSAEGDRTFSMPHHFDKIAKAFPKLKIIMAHCGMPHDYLEAIKVVRWNKNIYIGTHAVTTYVLNLAMQKVGAEKILLGTDSPFECFEVEMEKIKQITTCEKARRKILGGNAARLFGIV